MKLLPPSVRLLGFVGGDTVMGIASLVKAVGRVTRSVSGRGDDLLSSVGLNVKPLKIKVGPGML